MRTGLRRYARLVVAMGTMTALVAGPVIAGNMVPNADKVDGIHAVGSGTKASERAKKLVATNGNGQLPNNIIKKAKDANKLDGIDSTGFARTSDIAALQDDAADLGSQLDDKLDKVRHLEVVQAVAGDAGPSATQSGTALFQAVEALDEMPADDPAVVLVGPGTFDIGSEGLYLAPNVSLVGSGRHETTIRSSGTPATVLPSNNSTMTDLRIEHVASVGSVTGVHHYGGFDSQMMRVDIVVEDGTLSTTGIAVDYGEMLIKDVDVAAYTGNGTGNGLRLGEGADANVYDSTILGRFGNFANGIYEGPGSYVRVFRSDVEGRSAPNSWGIYADKASGEIWDSVIRSNAASSNAIALEVAQPTSGTRRFDVRNSVLEAWRNIDDATSSWTVVGRASTTINIANSQLDGGNPTTSGTLKCAAVYDEDFDFAASSCFP